MAIYFNTLVHDSYCIPHSTYSGIDLILNTFFKFEVCVSHGGKDVSYDLLGCDAM
jgi:hypothetical protein